MPLVLILDDERFQRLLLREILAHDPALTFAEAEDGLQALERARSERPNLILLDVMMPITDGLAACHLFKADPSLQSIPILLITAMTSIPQHIWEEVGADGFISKPFEDSELLAKVTRVLRHGQQRP
jgi:CheY-like chemotaxis protein